MERQRTLNETGISRGEGCYSFIHHWKHKTLKAENSKDEGDGRERGGGRIVSVLQQPFCCHNVVNNCT